MTQFDKLKLLAATSAAALSAIALAPSAARAQESGAPQLTITKTDPNAPVPGTMSEAAQQAKQHGPLPASDADLALKAAADRARAQAEKVQKSPFTEADRAPAGEAGATRPAAPTFAGINAAGLGPNGNAPPDTTGAIGPTRYIELVNTRAGIFGRGGVLLVSATLNELADQPATTNSFDPQIIWDNTTQRFYYAMDSVFSDTDNRLSFGFSKTATPTNLTTDWCHYQVNFGSRFPDYPKLGDSQHFIIIGVNSFGASFLGSDLVAIGKPPAGTACPAPATLAFGQQLNLPGVFTPVPANEIDTTATGFVVARNLSLPSNRLWLFNVTRNASTGAPVFGAARSVTVASYTVPANASQPTFTQVLDTLDARPTQAILAGDPRLGSLSLWTQHTIANGAAASGVRVYEIAPTPAVPILQRSIILGSANNFLFNASVSSDRRVDGATRAFGNNVVVAYNVSSATNNIAPRIVAASSINGAAIQFSLLKNGVGGYRDFTCPNPGDVCRWGDYSSVTPDPRPLAGATGVVWVANQYSGVVNPGTGENWRTQIMSVRP